MPVIGYLNSGTSSPTVSTVAAFRQGLSETGLVEGQNVAIEYRWAENQLIASRRLPERLGSLSR